MAEKKNKAPAFQFYVKEYETDERVKMMDVAHEGCYLRLMCAQWMEGSIPADIPAIARLCRVTPGRMKKLWPALASCFQPHTPGRLINAKLATQRQEYDEWVKKSSAGGKRSGEVRRKKAKAKGASKGGSQMVRTKREPNANTAPASASALKEKQEKEKLLTQHGKQNGAMTPISSIVAGRIPAVNE